MVDATHGCSLVLKRASHGAWQRTAARAVRLPRAYRTAAEQGTVSVFPKAEDDVPAPPKDELNAHAFELHDENAKLGVAYQPKVDWSKGG